VARRNCGNLGASDVGCPSALDAIVGRGSGGLAHRPRWATGDAAVASDRRSARIRVFSPRRLTMSGSRGKKVEKNSAIPLTFLNGCCSVVDHEDGSDASRTRDHGGGRGLHSAIDRGPPAAASPQFIGGDIRSSHFSQASSPKVQQPPPGRRCSWPHSLRAPLVDPPLPVAPFDSDRRYRQSFLETSRPSRDWRGRTSDFTGILLPLR
jgi:hypothetical protein